jgi:ATP-binding cassette subfamily G (WHITE) protein 2 (SNQ2)
LRLSGIVLVFWIAFIAWFLAGTERAGNTSGGATQLVFKQDAKIPSLDSSTANDTEKGSAPSDSISEKKRNDAKAAQVKLAKSNSVFSWYHMNYDIELGGGKKRRLLDNVSGFVAPGKMTALMGESGAGKV